MPKEITGPSTVTKRKSARGARTKLKRVSRHKAAREHRRGRADARGIEKELIRVSRYEAAKEHRRESETTSPMVENEYKMDPKTRIIAKIGIEERKTATMHGWHVGQQSKAGRTTRQ